MPKPTNPLDPEFPPCFPLPEEVRSSATTAPAIPLERHKYVVFRTKNNTQNNINAAGLSGTSFRVVWLLFSLAPEIYSRLAGVSNVSVAILVSPEVRGLVVAQKGSFIPKATDASSDPATRSIARENTSWGLHRIATHSQLPGPKHQSP